MLTLSLLRHAKSAWDDPRAGDFERRLSPRGLRAAPVMARYIAERGDVPDLVVSSPARRTLETCSAVVAELRPEPEVRFEQALYRASAQTILGLVRDVADSYRHVLVVGHNPGLHTLAVDLVAAGRADPVNALRAKLPTAGLVVIRFDAHRWTDVAAGSGTLVDFTTPRLLGA